MGKGKKTCPECSAELGVRTKICSCGHEFAFKHTGARLKKGPPTPPRSEKPFENLTENPPEVVGINDRVALESFIEQLQACGSNSDNTGGCYSAFLHHRNGVLQVEVGFPLRLRGKLL